MYRILLAELLDFTCILSSPKYENKSDQGMVIYTWNLSPSEVEKKRSGVQGQPVLCGDFQVGLGV